MIDYIGYTALGLGLFAITKRKMIPFRLWHLASAFCYLIYGIAIMAFPVILGGSLFIAIHTYHLFTSKKNKNERIYDNQKCN